VRGDFDTEHGPLSSADAAIIILLPIVAAAIGITIFGIEFQIVEHAM
jgi:ABC-type transport system involved in multi-copper enzyme maturation permease subunit